MKKIFWTDPYLTKLKTKVLDIQGNEIVFEETILFKFLQDWINRAKCFLPKILGA